MKLNGLRSIVACSLLAFTANAAFASNGFNILIDRLAEQEVFAPGEAQQLKYQIQEEMRVELAQGKVATMPKWIQTMKFKGDIRLRYQEDWKPGKADRSRGRVRFRLAGATSPAENFKVGFRISTDGGSNDPRSTNFTLGTTGDEGLPFGKSSILLDRAYLTYDPGLYTLSGGILKNPVWNATDLLWDGDISPQGVAGQIEPGKGTFVTAAAFILDEDKNDASDPMMYVVQPGISAKLGGNAKIKGALAYYTGNVKGKTIGGVTLPYEYNVLNPSVAVSFSDLFFEKVTVFGDYASHADADDDNTGYAAGFSFGSGAWSVKYIYRSLGLNAWYPYFPDSDAYGGATGVQGSEIVLKYALAKNTSLGIDYYNMDLIDGNAPQSLVQIDIVQKF